MPQTVALADEEMRRVLRTMSADIQASLALSRAALQAIASLSPATNAAAGEALDDELELARRAAAPQRMTEALEDARERLQDSPEQAEMVAALERALIAAAAALPDLADLETAEAVSRA